MESFKSVDKRPIMVQIGVNIFNPEQVTHARYISPKRVYVYVVGSTEPAFTATTEEWQEYCKVATKLVVIKPLPSSDTVNNRP